MALCPANGKQGDSCHQAHCGVARSTGDVIVISGNKGVSHAEAIGSITHYTEIEDTSISLAVAGLVLIL